MSFAPLARCRGRYRSAETLLCELSVGSIAAVFRTRRPAVEQRERAIDLTRIVAIIRCERIDTAGIDAEPLKLRRDAASPAALGQTAAHEHVGEPAVIDEAAGKGTLDSRFGILGLKALAHKTLSQLRAGLFAHKAEPLYLAESPRLFTQVAWGSHGRLALRRIVGKVGDARRRAAPVLNEGDAGSQIGTYAVRRKRHATFSS